MATVKKEKGLKMCQFFSLVSDGKGKVFYFDWKLRQKCLSGELKYEPDSHTSIADYYGYKADKEDKLNKYEYNFLTGNFAIDQLNTTDDSGKVKKICKKINSKKIVPQLIVKVILDPFKDKNTEKVTDRDLQLLKVWASVRASVRDNVGASVGASVWDSIGDNVRASVGDSVRASVWDSVWDNVWDNVWASVRDSVRDSVGASVRDSVRASVGASVWDSVGDNVGAYISSFFKIKYKFDFSSGVKLWKKGLVPSFDGTTWRLHGKDGKILKEITKEELDKI
jgi:hypothetical protein